MKKVPSAEPIPALTDAVGPSLPMENPLERERIEVMTFAIVSLSANCHEKRPEKFERQGFQNPLF